MAELVEANIEKFCATNAILLKRGVYGEREMREMVERRTDLEYKICRRIGRIEENYSDYIDYELHFYDDLDGRLTKSKRNRLMFTLKENERRIHRLFRRALSKFKDSFAIWVLHFEFCVKIGDFSILESSISNFVRLHFSQPCCWSIASKWAVHLSPSASERLLSNCPHTENIQIRFGLFQAKTKDLPLRETVGILVEQYKSFGNDFEFFKMALKEMGLRFGGLHEVLPEFPIFSFDNDVILYLGFLHLGFDEDKCLNICRDILVNDDKLFGKLVDNLVENYTKIEQKSNWIDLINTFKPSLDISINLQHYIRFCHSFNTPINEDASELIKTSNDITFECYHMYLSQVLTEFKPEKWEIIIHSLSKYPNNVEQILKLAFNSVINDYNETYFNKLFALLQKKYSSHVLKILNECYDYCNSTFGYKQFIKPIISKQIHSSILSLDLVNKVAESELAMHGTQKCDLLFVRNLYSKLSTREEFNKSTHFWKSYYLFEKKAVDLHHSTEFDQAHHVYLKAIQHLPTDHFQSFYSSIFNNKNTDISTDI